VGNLAPRSEVIMAVTGVVEVALGGSVKMELAAGKITKVMPWTSQPG
jgi:hypothetical protein